MEKQPKPKMAAYSLFGTIQDSVRPEMCVKGCYFHPLS